MYYFLSAETPFYNMNYYYYYYMVKQVGLVRIIIFVIENHFQWRKIYFIKYTKNQYALITLYEWNHCCLPLCITNCEIAAG